MSELPPVITPTNREHALIDMIARDALDLIRRNPKLLDMPAEVFIDMLYAQREPAWREGR